MRASGLMVSEWRDEMNRCSVELIKNELLMYFSIDESCLEFDKNVKEYTNFLKAAINQDKYSLRD